MMVFILALVAFSVDLGIITLAKTEIKRSTDAAALAGAGVLIEGTEAANRQAFELLVRNPVGNFDMTEGDDAWEDNLATLMEEHADEFETEVGHWNPETRTFEVSDELPSTIRVVATRPNLPLFFSGIFGINNFSVSAESIAQYQPRDIAVVLDFSGSMNDDSELKRIDSSGNNREVVEASLAEIYADLGSPTYGDMEFTPQYISTTDTTQIKKDLGLRYYQDGMWHNVPYPYPSGSWDDYINYVKNNYNVYRAGYRKKYGYMTLINYWLESKCQHSQTPDLWKGNAQPIGSVKDAVAVFMEYIQEVDTDDRVALVIYNSYSQQALVEHSLTEDFAAVSNTVEHRQAGHYDSYTNIGDGIRYAKQELDANGRMGAFKMIVLMTDGIANKPSGVDAAQYAKDQADLAKENGYPIVTISLGSGADTSLMQSIADRTNGHHFNIPGTDTVTDHHEDLLQVFRNIADARPLILVK
ncbi:MAG: VWA domain-containing protein [Pirellulales bacterium]|nr:VWA domain-containing protein [Pirellulales bacterium]